MNIKELSLYSDTELAALMCRIPFYKELQQASDDQLHQLLAHSCLLELAPGEVLMRRGDRGSWLYFLIKGRLSVYLEQTQEQQILSHITPGELFGDLALLCDHERKATVAADRGKKPALLFATDFKPFGQVEDFSVVALSTKLIFYRCMLHSIRWRMELKRSEQPSPTLLAELRKVPVYSGPRDCLEELLALHRQATVLAGLLDRWNSEATPRQELLLASAGNETCATGRGPV